MTQEALESRAERTARLARELARREAAAARACAAAGAGSGDWTALFETAVQAGLRDSYRCARALIARDDAAAAAPCSERRPAAREALVEERE